MNPGHKIICIESGPIAFTDSYGDEEILPPVPELTIGKVYTVEKVIPASDSFSFPRIVLVEEKDNPKPPTTLAVLISTECKMGKFDKAVTFQEAFAQSELTGLPEFYCEVSFMLPRVPGHLLLGCCDICDQNLEGKPHLCFGEVKHDDFEFDFFDFDEEDDDDED